jgi:acyl-coenzyme A synthetase/AMP-(fatty) acid ligase
VGYRSEYQRSIENAEDFWAEQAERILWFEKPKEILSQDENGFYRWFKGGKLNTSYLALDYHVENGHGNQTAIIYDSPVTDTKERISFRDFRDQVALFAGVLKNLGVGKGDRVVIYMPMVPEALTSMLACARLGAIHSVVFGGFASRELAIRIDDARPKVIVSASCGIEGDRVIPYKPLLDGAIELAQHKPDYSVILARPHAAAEMKPGRDFDWHEAMSKASPEDYVPVDSLDPLYILYTSGTTGKPKGVLRDNGGHAVALTYSMDAIYNVKQGDVYWAASDVGWVVGHSYIAYAPLLAGCSTVIFEGKPVRTPDAGSFWRVISEYKVKSFFTAPTAFRAVKKEDPKGEFLQKYDISCLNYVFLAGERLDPPTYHWIRDLLNIPVLDHWWQTETGWAIAANMAGIELLPVKPGSATVPACGYDVRILDAGGKEVKQPYEPGAIVIKLPLPPGCFPTLWNDDEGFRSSYLEEFPGYYVTGDGGYKDEDGYLFIMGRMDDIINVAGHRLSTGEMEELIAGHPVVAECAVVGIVDAMRGQVPVGLVVLKDGCDVDEKALEKELVSLIREKVGAFAYLRKAAVVKQLPKTRSGKILRKILRKMADGEKFSVPSTIDDPKTLDEIREKMAEEKIGISFSEEKP